MNATQATKVGKAFYYPYIEIQDINWLKQALLYWDGLRRIVPPDYSPNDSFDVCQVIDTGFLENTSPENYRQAASERFLQQFKPLGSKSILSQVEQLLSYDSVSQKNFLLSETDFFSHDAEEFLGIDFWDINNLRNLIPVENLYEGQATDEVFKILESFRLANKSDDDTSYEVHALLGGFYRMCLATEMSEKIGISLVTDSYHYKKCVEYLSFGEPLINNPSDAQFGVLVELGIEFPTSQFLEQIPLSEIIKFHNRRKDERKRFREAIESTISGVKSISDPYALQDYFKTRKDEVQSAFQEHRRALTDLNIDSFNSLLKVNVPTTITATVAAGLVAAPIAPVIAGVGITVGLVTWWTEVSRKTKDANKSPWHYLLSIKELTPPPEATPIYMYPLF